MAEELPIKYVKDKDGRFIPITSPNAVINGDGKNINEIFVSYRKGSTSEVEINELLEKVYPIGSIYMSIENNSPASFLGGEWVAIESKFLLGAGSSYSAGSTGGEAMHTLTVNEMPSHSHNLELYASKGATATSKIHGVQDYNKAQWWDNYKPTYEGVINNTGGGQPHNNMPPYLAVYMWKRIA